MDYIYGTGIPCSRCVFKTVYLAHGNRKGEARGRSRHKNNERVRNLEKWNVGTKGKKSQPRPN